MKLLFKAKTLDGYILKNLFELLHSNHKTAFFRVNKKGLFSRMFDPNKKILSDTVLNYDKFNFYQYRGSGDLLFSFNLSHIYKLMKSARKKDAITLCISQENRNKLKIIIVPNENNKKSVKEMEIPIQYDVQNLDIDLPEGYEKSIIINSTEFQKACKQLTALSDNILVSSEKFHVSFSSDNNVYSNKITLGEMDSSENSESESGDSEDFEKEESDGESERILTQNFKSISLSKIIKISGLSSNMQIFMENDLPLIFKSNIGILGTITLYIKSNELLEKEKEDL
jgi:proliferating cell nuclear antigen